MYYKRWRPDTDEVTPPRSHRRMCTMPVTSNRHQHPAVMDEDARRACRTESRHRATGAGAQSAPVDVFRPRAIDNGPPRRKYSGESATRGGGQSDSPRSAGAPPCRLVSLRRDFGRLGRHPRPGRDSRPRSERLPSAERGVNSPVAEPPPDGAVVDVVNNGGCCSRARTTERGIGRARRSARRGPAWKATEEPRLGAGLEDRTVPTRPRTGPPVRASPTTSAKRREG